MTGNDAIRLAREAGLNLGYGSPLLSKCLRFAALVVAAEREANAQEFDRRAASGTGFYEPEEPAQIIRARSEQ